MPDWVVPDALADSDDLAAWIGAAAPANADALLRKATSMVLKATKLAIYATDTTTGLASDPVILQCMNDATCIQAAALNALNIDPLAGGIQQGGFKSTKKIGTATISIAGAEQTAAAIASAATQLVPDALEKLRSQNLLSTWPSREYGYGNVPGVWPNEV
jgi:hypothetical protein